MAGTIQSQGLGLQQNYAAPATPLFGATGTIQTNTASNISGGVVSGTGTGFMAGGPVGAGVGLASGIIKSLFDYYGMKRQEKENQRVEKINLALASQDREDRLKAQRWQQQYQEQQLKDQEEMSKYNKVTNFVTGFQNQLDRKPQLATNIINMWNARR